MFGQAASAQKPLFGQQQPAQSNTPSLFGGQQSGAFGQANAQGAAPGLFGSSTSQQQPSTSLFGQNNASTTNTQQPAQSGGLFGSSSTTQQPAQTSTSLFGQSTAQQPQQSTSLFGGSAAKPTTSLFGQSTAPAQTSTGLFGQSSTNQQQQPSTSLFGQPAQNQTQNQVQNQQQAQITMTTKYSELSPSIQQELDTMEKFIQSQIQQSSAMSLKSLTEPLDLLEKDSLSVKRKLTGLQALLKRDGYVIDQLKSVLSRELRSSDLIARYTENPSGMHKSSSQHDPYNNDLESRMNTCRQTIEELEMNIRNQSIITPSVIEEIIKSQYYSFMAVASKVAAVHDATLKAKEILDQFQLLHGKGMRGLGGKESFGEMAKLLVPEGQGQVKPGGTGGSGGGMFGSGNTGGTGLFGKSTTGTGLFGGNTGGATGLFGSSTSGTGLFGNTTATTPATGLFGNTTATTPATGLFGNTTATTPATGLFGGAKRSNSLGN